MTDLTHLLEKAIVSAPPGLYATAATSLPPWEEIRRLMGRPWEPTSWCVSPREYEAMLDDPAWAPYARKHAAPVPARRAEAHGLLPCDPWPVLHVSRVDALVAEMPEKARAKPRTIVMHTAGPARTHFTVHPDGRVQDNRTGFAEQRRNNANDVPRFEFIGTLGGVRIVCDPDLPSHAWGGAIIPPEAFVTVDEEDWPRRMAAPTPEGEDRMTDQPVIDYPLGDTVVGHCAGDPVYEGTRVPMEYVTTEKKWWNHEPPKHPGPEVRRLAAAEQRERRRRQRVADIAATKEFCAALDEVRATGDRTAMRMLELHTPDPGRYHSFVRCEGCNGGGCCDDDAEWPCSTIDAIADLNGIPVPERVEFEKEPADG